MDISSEREVIENKVATVGNRDPFTMYYVLCYDVLLNVSSLTMSSLHCTVLDSVYPESEKTDHRSL